MTEEISAGNEENSANSISVDLSGATIALDDADDSSVNSNEDAVDIRFPNSIIPANTNINVEGSNDVVIGTVAQFHGPVTIYQNTHNNAHVHGDTQKYLTNGEKPPSSTASSEAKLVATESLSGNVLPNFGKIPFRQKRIPILPLIIFVILVSICVIVGITAGLYLNAEHAISKTDDDYEKTTQSDQTSKHKFITREGWNARKPTFIRPMKVPVAYVIISHTAGDMCDSYIECAQVMRNIQSLHVKNESPDIGYNFVIGGDENIYEGRGWEAHNFHMDLDTIGICFTGNYIYDRLTPGMIVAAQELLKKGIDEGKLTPDYKLIAHNQTYNTDSPGPNIFKIIKYWPNYYPGIVRDKQ